MEILIWLIISVVFFGLGIFIMVRTGPPPPLSPLPYMAPSRTWKTTTISVVPTEGDSFTKLCQSIIGELEYQPPKNNKDARMTVACVVNYVGTRILYSIKIDRIKSGVDRISRVIYFPEPYPSMYVAKRACDILLRRGLADCKTHVVTLSIPEEDSETPKRGVPFIDFTITKKLNESK